jgi:hypothetical protein
MADFAKGTTIITYPEKSKATSMRKYFMVSLQPFWMM